MLGHGGGTIIKNLFRRALLERKLTFGAWVQIGHPSIAEIFSRRGFDWICVDLEHGAIDIESLAAIFRAVKRYDSVPVARLPLNDPVWIRRSLDAGAGGLIIPMVRTSEEAANAVRDAKYPPMGDRGFGYSCANNYGIDFDEYTGNANDEIAMIMQIEHKDSITNLESILGVEGVDGVFIGPLDLSGSMGITGEMEHPVMKEALEKYKRLSREAGKSFGVHLIRPDEDKIKGIVNQGYTLIALGADSILLDESSKNLRGIADKLREPGNTTSSGLL